MGTTLINDTRAFTHWVCINVAGQSGRAYLNARAGTQYIRRSRLLILSSSTLLSERHRKDSLPPPPSLSPSWAEILYPPLSEPCTSKLSRHKALHWWIRWHLLRHIHVPTVSLYICCQLLSRGEKHVPVFIWQPLHEAIAPDLRRNRLSCRCSARAGNMEKDIFVKYPFFYWLYMQELKQNWLLTSIIMQKEGKNIVWNVIFNCIKYIGNLNFSINHIYSTFPTQKSCASQTKHYNYKQ